MLRFSTMAEVEPHGFTEIFLMDRKMAFLMLKDLFLCVRSIRISWKANFCNDTPCLMMDFLGFPLDVTERFRLNYLSCWRLMNEMQKHPSG